MIRPKSALLLHKVHRYASLDIFDPRVSYLTRARYGFCGYGPTVCLTPVDGYGAPGLLCI